MAKRTITLTNRPPVSIDEEQWGTIAVARDYDNQHECQANTLWTIRVRQHDDGRAIVYATKAAGPGGKSASFRPSKAGELLPADCTTADICESIRRVGEAADCCDLVDECIADMPAEELT